MHNVKSKTQNFNTISKYFTILLLSCLAISTFCANPATAVDLSATEKTGVVLTINSQDAAIEPLELKAGQQILIGLSGAAELEKKKYDLSIVLTGGTLQESASLTSKKNTATDMVQISTDSLDSVGDYIFSFSDSIGSGLAVINLITNTDMVIDGVGVDAGTTIYQLILFELTDAKQVVAFGVNYESLSYVPEVQEDLSELSLKSMDLDSESMMMSMSYTLPDPVWFDSTQECPDLDNDDFVNFKDFVILSDNWMQTGHRLKGDFDDSNSVDVNDLKHLCQYWLTPVECPGDEFPYITSFESYQGFVVDTLYSDESVKYWLVEEGRCYIREATYYQDPEEDLDYQYADVYKNSTFSRLFTGVEDSNNSYVRISCIPDVNSYINLKYENKIVASIKFDDSNNIFVWTDDNNDGNFEYVDTSTDYNTVAEQCRTFLNNTNPDLTDYSYENSWIEFEIRFDWNSNTYDVYWEHYNGSGLLADDIVFDFNGTDAMFDNVEFINASDDSSNYLKINRISITDEANIGGVFGDTNDIYITGPSAGDEFSGDYDITGNIWYDKFGRYEIKICQSNLEPNGMTEINDELIDNWLFVCEGNSVVIDDSFGQLDTGNYFNGDYYMRIFVYDDLGRLLNPLNDSTDPNAWQVGVKTKRLYYKGQNHTQFAEYTIAGKLKGQGFHYDEQVADVSIDWAGSFPFEFRRIYDSSLRNQVQPLFFGWTHNHNIRIYESTKSYFKTVDVNSQSVPDKDSEGIGVGKLFLLTPLGGRLFEGKVSDSNSSIVIYTPQDNEPDYIERTSSLSGNTFDVEYTYHRSDGMVYFFDANDNNIPYTPDTNEGVVDWMVYKAIDYQQDRFDNKLSYTYGADEKFIEEISNNSNSIKIVLANGKISGWSYGPDLYTGVGISNGSSVTQYYEYRAKIQPGGIHILSVINAVSNQSKQIYQHQQTDNHIVLSLYPEYLNGEGGGIYDLHGAASTPSFYSYPLFAYDKEGVLMEKYRYVYACDIATYSGAVLWKEKRQIAYDERGYQILESTFMHGYNGTDNYDHCYKTITTTRNTNGAILSIKTESNILDKTINYDRGTYHWPKGHVFAGISGGGGYIDFEYLYENPTFPLKPTAIIEYFDDNADGSYDGQERLTTMAYDGRGNLTEKRQYIDGTYFLLTQYEYHPKYNFQTSMKTWQDYCSDNSGAGEVSRIEKQWIYGDANGIVDVNGNYLICEKTLIDSNGTEAISDDIWKKVYYTYYSNGKVKTQSLPDNNSIGTYYEYNGDGLISEVYEGIDITGQFPGSNNPQKRFVYDANDRLVLQADSLGKVVYMAHDNTGNVIEVKQYDDADAMTRSNFNTAYYDSLAFRTIETFQKHTWYGKPYKTTSPYGANFEMYYRRDKLLRKAPMESSVEYYAAGQVEDFLPDGRTYMSVSLDTTSTIYNWLNPFLYVSYTDVISNYYYTNTPFCQASFSSYDSMGRVNCFDIIADADPCESYTFRKKRTLFNYYGSGTKESEKTYNSYRTPVFYNDDEIIWQELESEIYYDYDILDRMTYKVIDPNNANLIYTYDYDATGNKLYTMDPCENVVFADYDNSNRTIRQYHPTPAVYFYGLVYDPDLTKQVAKLRTEIEYYNDDKVKNIKQYDLDGTTVLKQTGLTYDSRGRIARVTEYIDDVNTAVTTYDYRDAGNGFTDSRMPDWEYHIKITDAENQITLIALGYDGKTEQILHPDDRYQQYENILLYDWDDYDEIWDVNTNESYVTTGIAGGPNSTIIHYRDKFGCIVKTEYPDGGYIETDYVMPGFGKYQKPWFVRDFRNPNDKLADVNSYEYSFDGITGNISYYRVFDANDNKLFSVHTDWQARFKNNKKAVRVYDSNDLIYDVEYRYDLAGRLIDVNDAMIADGNYANIADFDYDGQSNRVSSRYYLDGQNADVDINYAYNYRRKLIGIDVNSIGNATYTFDANGGLDGLGRLTDANEIISLPGYSDQSHNYSYAYDMRSQLTSADIDSTEYIYSYKDDGNIDQQTVDSNTINYSYETGDGNSTDIMTSAGDTDLIWDANGRLSDIDDYQFIYNYQGKLREVLDDSNQPVIKLKYDPMGNRVYKWSINDGNSIERKYIVDISGKLPTILCEIDANNSSLEKSYIYSNRSEILSQYDCNGLDGNDDVVVDGKYFYIHDRLGSIRVIINESADVNNSYTYSPFGESFATECYETIYNPFKFTGQWFDEEIGQYYLRARMYDPALMRFTGRDPVRGKRKSPLTFNPYLYCQNNSINRIDTDGRFSLIADMLFSSALGSHMRAAHTKQMKGVFDKSKLKLDAFSMMNLQRGVVYDMLAADYGGGLKGSLMDAGVKGLGLISPNLERIVSSGAEGWSDRKIIMGILEDESWSGLFDYARDKLMDIVSNPY